MAEFSFWKTRLRQEEHMKWITREHVKVDRVACPWLIRKFVDENAEFIFAPADKVMAEAKRLDAVPYDVRDVELGHHGKECSFEAILKKYKLTGDPALVLLGRIVNGADTDNTLYHQAEGPGLEAIAEGFRHLGYKDDHALNARRMDRLRRAICLCPGNGEARQARRPVFQLIARSADRFLAAILCRREPTLRCPTHEHAPTACTSLSRRLEIP
jgi:hypothetical protein